MPIYIYESIPERPGDPVQRFEMSQRMVEAPYSRHPETGQRIRRIITGGVGFVVAGKPAAAAPTAKRVSRGCGCGSGCGCG